ncbi:MAG: CoA transferase [Chloroflexi bacterium]|nr:CoA transferase [Chloroflexota bacterium]
MTTPYDERNSIGTPLPLSGVRVLDLTWVVSGPQGSRILADLGAEVIKIEAPGRPDQTRRSQGSFIYLNRNKLGLSLNLGTEEGKAIFQKLVAVSDVVMENFSAHVMEHWGFDYLHLRAINPAIIYLSMPGFGHSGPYQDYQSNGPTIQALSGQNFMIGLAGMPPAGWGYSYMDHTAGHYGAMGVLQALYYRNNTGKGQFIDLAQYEAACNLMGVYLLDYAVNGRSQRRPDMPADNRSLYPPAAPHGVYRCKGEDRWCAITVFTDEEWRAFCNALEDPQWARDAKFATADARVQHQEELNKRVEEWTSKLTHKEVMDRLQAAGVPAGVVQDPQQRAEEDPQLKARDHIVEMETAGRTLRVDSLPMTIPAVPHEAYRLAPELGEHNRRVLVDLLGMSEEELERLTRAGVI